MYDNTKAGKSGSPDISELSSEQLDALIKRMEEAIEFDLSLSTDDLRLLLQAVLTLAAMQERLSDKDITLNKLRKLVGMVQSSEKLSDLLNKPETGEQEQEEKPVNKVKPVRKKKPRLKKTIPPTKVHHTDLSYEGVSLNKGDTCPECLLGTLYKYEPAQLLRISGHSPFSAHLHLRKRLRCNACGQFYTASMPDEILAEGETGQKYGYSARALMAINKYFTGTPFYRQQSLQDLLGFSISASTIFDQTEYLANDIQPIFTAFKSLAANADHYHLDDTTHRILMQQPIEKNKRNSDIKQLRTGIYASGIIATTDDGHDIILFQTTIGHAGEFIDELLTKRDPDRSPPILMSDALASNNPTVTAVHHGACNSHARRNFVDVISHFPDEVEWLLQQYKMIWVYDQQADDSEMNSAQRLQHHQLNSLPVMQKIRDWGQQHFDDETVEENSALGKAIAYFNKHYDRLTLFCTMEGAKVDNNTMEAILKLIVRNRKNAYFYKTLVGASISDVITSIIATCLQANVNAFDYLTAIQRNRAVVAKDPMNWMPWNYLE